MNREKAEKLLAALIFDDLDEASKADLLAYLRTDDELRERLADMRMAAKVTSDALQHGPDPVLDKKRLKRLERLAARRSPCRVFFTRPRLAAAAAIVAAILLPALMILPSLNRTRMYSPSASKEHSWKAVALYNTETSGRKLSYGSPEGFARLTQPASPQPTEPYGGGGVFYFGDADQVTIANSTLKNLAGGDAAAPTATHFDPAPEHVTLKTADAGAVINDYVVAADESGGTGAPLVMSTSGGGPDDVTNAWRRGLSEDNILYHAASKTELPSATWETPLGTTSGQEQSYNYVLPLQSTYSFPLQPGSTVSLYNGSSLSDVALDGSTDVQNVLANVDVAGQIVADGQNVTFTDRGAPSTAEGLAGNIYDVYTGQAASTDLPAIKTAEASPTAKPPVADESYQYGDAKSEYRNAWGYRSVVSGPTERPALGTSGASPAGRPAVPTESGRYAEAPSESRAPDPVKVVVDSLGVESQVQASSGLVAGKDSSSSRYMPTNAPTLEPKLDLGAESELLDREKSGFATTTYGTAKQHSRRDEASSEGEMLAPAKPAEKYLRRSGEGDERTATVVGGGRFPAGERRTVDNDFELDVANKEAKQEQAKGKLPLLGDLPITGEAFRMLRKAEEASSEEHAKRQRQAGAMLDDAKSKSEPAPAGPTVEMEYKSDATTPRAFRLDLDGFADGKEATTDEIRVRIGSGTSGHGGMGGMGGIGGGYRGGGGLGGMGGYGGMYHGDDYGAGMGGYGMGGGLSLKYDGSADEIDRLITAKSGGYGGATGPDDMFGIADGDDFLKYKVQTGATDLDAIKVTELNFRGRDIPEVGGREDVSSSHETEYEIVNLRYAEPREIEDFAGDGFRDQSGRQRVLIEPLRETRQVIVFGSKEMREEAKKMIEKIDTPAGYGATDSNSMPGEEDVTDLPEAARFKLVPVNPWVMTQRDSLSTFALDVDTASYTLCRRYIRGGFLPPAGAVRMEEFINYFNYDYPQRSNPTFAVHAQAARSPFAREGQNLTLLKIGVKARTLGRDQQRPAHLIIVVDASASMNQPDRLPLVQKALGLLVSKLSPADRVSLITCSREARLHLEAVSAQRGNKIREAMDAIQSSGPTNLLAGLKLGYATARKEFDPKQINHVVLCSDGVANVGETEAEAVLKEVSADREQGIAITCVGVGYGAYNDAFLESLANRGDGSYVFLDSMKQARRVFVDQLAATLHTVAKDARIQVEFDPKQVRRYRLIGYENRDIEDKKFRDDTIDAGEVGSGQCSTALYELELTGQPSADLGTVFVRYRNVETGQFEEISEKLSGTVIRRLTVESAPRFFLAAVAARFAEILRESEHAQQASLTDLQRVAQQVSLALPLDRDVRQLAELINKAENLPKAP